MNSSVPNKNTGDSLTAAEFNDLKNATNSKEDAITASNDVNKLFSGDKSWKNLSELPAFASVITRLNALEYIPIAISTFTNNINNVEKGTTVSSITFGFTFNKVPTSASINNSIGNINTGGTSQTFSVNITTNTSYILTASDGTNTVTATSSVNFLNKVYYGTSANTSLTSSQVLALSSNTLSSTKNRTISINGNGQYIYYCYPASMGDATFTINGLVSNSFTKTVMNVTNALGDVTSYNVYKSNTVQNGTGINITIS